MSIETENLAVDINDDAANATTPAQATDSPNEAFAKNSPIDDVNSMAVSDDNDNNQDKSAVASTKAGANKSTGTPAKKGGKKLIAEEKLAQKQQIIAKKQEELKREEEEFAKLEEELKKEHSDALLLIGQEFVKMIMSSNSHEYDEMTETLFSSIEGYPKQQIKANVRERIEAIKNQWEEWATR